MGNRQKIASPLIIFFDWSIIRAVKLGEYVNNQLNKRNIKQLWLMQLSITLVLTAFYAFALGLNAAISALLGGLVCILPNALFAVKLFKLNWVAALSAGLVLCFVFALELGVAFLQAYVFITLVCIYFNDSLNLAH